MNYAFVGCRKWLLVVICLAGAAACQPPLETLPPSPTLLVQHIDVQTPTPSPTGEASRAGYQVLPLYTPNSTPPPPPTPTPFTYKVKKDDTMLGIALRYGIPLVDLQAANPDVNARMMPVDTVLIIPLPTPLPDTSSPPPQPTVLPVVVEPAGCYAVEDGGLWCFAPVKNEGTEPLESLSAWMTLYTTQGEVLTTTQVALLLNILPPGQSLPLALYLPDAGPQVDDLTAALVDQISAFSVVEAGRYILVQLEDLETVILEGGVAADFSAQVFYSEEASVPQETPSPPASTPAAGETPQPPPEPPAARHLWAAAVAYDEEGQVVGVRRFEWEVELHAGERFEIEGSVYSAGPSIARVLLVVEARP